MNSVYFTGPDNDARPRSQQAAGSLNFPGNEISLSKTADGAMLRLGYVMHLVPGVHVSISGITGEIAFLRHQSALQLGIAFDPDCYVVDTDHQFQGGARQSIIRGQLRLPLTLGALEAAERFRDGAPPEFAITLRATAFVGNKETERFDACRLDFAPIGPIQLHADRDTWQRQIRNVSPMGSVLAEIPLAVTREAPWDRVWARLDAASANLAHGGESGSKNCVSEIRQALEAWRAIDGFNARLSPAERQKDKRQRLFDVASALQHYCSLSVHADEHQTEWNRADAIMALSTLCALLSARNP